MIFDCRFPTFLAVLESKYSGGGTLDMNGVTEAIDDLYQNYVGDVIKKVKKEMLNSAENYQVNN